MAKKRAAPADGAPASRVTFSTKAARTQDEECKVRVYITGVDSTTSKPLPNNITKTLYISDATVGDVADQIADLFNE